MKEFTVSAFFNVSCSKLYRAWLSNDGHTQMTGAKAQISAETGERFSAWDGYITGKNLELKEPNRIIQSWRTSEFTEQEEDSIIEIDLKIQDGGTLLTLTHKNLPDHGEQYKQGWLDHYFEPMAEFFG